MEVLNRPLELPIVNTLQVWLAKVATALTEASVRNDKAEVGWLMKATGNSETFESFLTRAALAPMDLAPCLPPRSSPR